MIFNLFKKREEEKENIVQPVSEQTNSQVNELYKSLVDSLSNLNKSIKNLEARISEINEKIAYNEELSKKHEEEISELKNALEKMVSLYDLLSKQYNPFIEEETPINKKTQEVIVEEKKVSEEAVPLDEIRNDPAFIAIILGWLNYLVKKSNIEEAKRALEYYEDIGWITEDVKIKLLNYLKGFVNIETENNKLTPEDHLVSLYIISKLKIGLNGDIVRFKELYEELISKGIIYPI